jgi:hypothetical protein
MGRGAAALGVDEHDRNRQIVRDERSAAEKKCQPLACQLQACASRYIYSQHKCNDLKRTYEKCIADFLEKMQPPQ